MKKSRTMLVGLLAMVLMTGGFSLNAVAQDNSVSETEIPKILRLNPSLDFEKEAIKNWAEKHSWKKANSLVQKAHSRWYKEGMNQFGVRFYTPIMAWVEAMYKGEQRFWSKEKIEEKYSSYLHKPTKSSYFLVLVGVTDKASVKAENWRFILEVGEKNWEASNVTAGNLTRKEYSGTNFYLKSFGVHFDFTNTKGHPEWSKWTFHLIRKDIMWRKKFVWQF